MMATVESGVPPTSLFFSVAIVPPIHFELERHNYIIIYTYEYTYIMNINIYKYTSVHFVCVCVCVCVFYPCGLCCIQV